MKKTNCELFSIGTQTECFNIINVDKMGKMYNLDNYKKAGVWALFAKQKLGENKKWFCLQVGQSKDIAYEIKIDNERINENIVYNREKNYVNQFKQKIFSYSENPSIQEMLYNHINDNYTDFKFTCVSLEENPKIRKEIESYFACKTRAIYWRNGRPYEDGDLLNLNEHFNDSVKVISFAEPDKVKNKKEIDEFLNCFLSL
ncbi:hypothetical protein [Clostridium beijerinckii]|uniref:Uncharacterized protein n=1 Tax=Clostridium beijerinckii TaxID=1520 RepID=A0AAW3WG15_CLOBE|nr:hypothetical protein [Clostridium beijerinckii]MBC2460321.1 hypothetical protein [Clostridium beijerinckii]MBC2477815.1 hypothetical protein [Clostridium beijerinckii]NOV59030.1 hypothetical protein [Clostridium beijerinckii]NOV71582.1 hypothetical protein [Clostridium beijerinckii]NOW32385.1 hypothetical protein [Clostridium beijerinckii]